MGDRAMVISIDSLEDSDIPYLLEKKDFNAPTLHILTPVMQPYSQDYGQKTMEYITTNLLIPKGQKPDGSGGLMS